MVHLFDSTTPPTNAGTYQVTIAISPGHVCKGSTAFDFTIDKAPAFATIHADAQLQPSGVATIDLASVPGLPGDLGSGPAYAVKSFTSEGLADASVDAVSYTHLYLSGYRPYTHRQATTAPPA